MDKTATLGKAFLRKEPCSITYRDSRKRWTRRTIWIERMERDYLLARCELRDGAYRTLPQPRR